MTDEKNFTRAELVLGMSEGDEFFIEGHENLWTVHISDDGTMTIKDDEIDLPQELLLHILNHPEDIEFVDEEKLRPTGHVNNNMINIIVMGLMSLAAAGVSLLFLLVSLIGCGCIDFQSVVFLLCLLIGGCSAGIQIQKLISLIEKNKEALL